MGYKKILLAVPYRNPHEATIQFAVNFAQEHNAQLTLFGVTEEIEKSYEGFLTTKPVDELMESMQAKQAAALAELEQKLKNTYASVDSEVAMGIPFTEIIKKVQKDDYDLLILDAVHRNDSNKRFMGSTTKHVFRKCPCPVLSIRDKAKPKTILAAVDVYAPGDSGEPLNRQVLKRAKQMADHYGAALYVVYAQQPMGEPMLSSWGIGGDDVLRNMQAEIKEDSRNRLQELVDECAPGDDVKATVVTGHPRDAIPDYVSANNIDLIVMGTVCRTGIKGFLVGNTAESILSEVNCSILALKPEGFVSTVR